jgi:hypothetical protein
MIKVSPNGAEGVYESKGSEQLDDVKLVYIEIVEAINFNALPSVHKVSPYNNLSDTAPAHIEENVIEKSLSYEYKG